MNESFLHFIWKNKLFNTTNLVLSTGESLEIIDIGEPNTDAGPDFSNVRIKIEDTTWAGCAEIHIRASDWIKHRHNNDNAYNNVVLHVVAENDKVIERENGEVLPAIELPYNKNYLKTYHELYRNKKWVACQDKIQVVNPITLRHWLGRLTIERLEKKSNTITELLKIHKNSWEDVLYQALARNFGFKVNALPFEMLTNQLPLKYIIKHKDNLIQIEALLFGVGGFLDDTVEDDYFLALKKEFRFLQSKYQLQQMDKSIWKFLRLRPVNFPTIRLAQFASLLFKSSFLFSKLLDCKTNMEFRKLFITNTSEYWKTHYTFGKPSKMREKSIGEASINILLINTIVPTLFSYGKKKGMQHIMDRAIKLLEEIEPEKNTQLEKWNNMGIWSENAFYTQALLQLKNEYCNFRRCLDCQIGNTIIITNK